MQYDYTGMRVKKDAPTGLTLFPFQGYEIAPDGEITKFIRIGVETFAAKRGTLQRFYHNDHLGSVNVITDINGVQVQRNEYDPWGSVSKQVGNDDPTHRFTGKELDPESGLYYYGGRYYDPEISRFVSADPFVPQPGNPQSLNRYSYTINNPQRYIDPSGFSFWSAIGNFFKNLFRKPQVFLASLVVGIVTGGAAAWAGASWAVAAAVGGAAAGITGAGMTGGNIWQAGLIGFISGGVGGGVFGALGGPAAGFGAVAGAAFAGGATAGALNTAFNGGNFIVNTLAGGVTSVITAAAVYGAGKAIGAAYSALKNNYQGATGHAPVDTQSDSVSNHPFLKIPSVDAALKGEVLAQENLGIEMSGSGIMRGNDLIVRSLMHPSNTVDSMVFDNFPLQSDETRLFTFHTHPGAPNYYPGPSMTDVTSFQNCGNACGYMHYVIHPRTGIYAIYPSGRVTFLNQ